jgi:maleate isomerase
MEKSFKKIQSRIDYAELPPVFDEGAHSRAKIGFVLLATEQTIEDDMMRLCPDGVGMHFTRAINPDSITVDSLRAQEPDLSRAAATLLPDGSLDVICYACTSGSLVIGEDNVFAALRKGAPQAEPTSLISAVMRALTAIGAQRIAVATPYLDEVNLQEANYMTARGFSICNIQGLNLEKDSDMVRVSPAFIHEFAASVDCDDAEAVFISCGALRALSIVDALEQKLGKPLICSNQAMLWDCLRRARITDQIFGYGRLLSAF